MYVYLKHGIDGNSYKALNGLAAVKKYDRLAGRMGAKCSALANQLRLELGLGPPGLGPDTELGGGGSLRFIDGYLVADNGQVVLAAVAGGPLRHSHSSGPTAGRSVRQTMGSSRSWKTRAPFSARTGEGIVLHGV